MRRRENGAVIRRRTHPIAPRRAGLRGDALILVAMFACSSADRASPPSCDEAAQLPLVNGSVQESYLGLGGLQIRAIVQIADAANSDGGQCTGAFVAPGWVITAGHCLILETPEIVVPADGNNLPSRTLRILRAIRHPTQDVALLNVDTFDDTLGVRPFEVREAGVLQLAAADAVELAGYGITLSSTPRSLQFLVETVTSVDSEMITVDGFGSSGACVGDSGGPLLVRAADGAAVVAGVLSRGSSTCRDHDKYVRLDSIEAWIRPIVGEYVSGDAECGTISDRGRCLYGTALWCAGAKLVARVCDLGTQCGWDVAQSAFRCVTTSSDPCEGIDSVGACVASVAERCNSGELERQSCAPCKGCRIDGRTGQPVCSGGFDGG